MTAKPFRMLFLRAHFLCSCLLIFGLTSCSGDSTPIAAERYLEADKLFETLEANVRANPRLEVIADIDHSRLAAAAGSSMPPAHVLIWSDSELEAAILKHAPLAAIDLPLHALAYEDQASGSAAVIANSFDYLVNRYELPDQAELRDRYESAVAAAMAGIPERAIMQFPLDTISDYGLVTLDSPFDFATTEQRIQNAIDAQSDTVNFGSVDFAERSRKHGVGLHPLRLLLFGGPGPGGQAMASAPTLGLDAFCQKLLIWEDVDGHVHVTFNDLLALAERQGVSKGIPLRVINWRVKDTFTEALKP